MDSIGVRELRQHASRYLERVMAGESLQVTDRGRLVALLVPPPQDPWDELVERGLITPAALGGGVLGLQAVTLPPGTPSLTEALVELRDDER